MRQPLDYNRSHLVNNIWVNALQFLQAYTANQPALIMLQAIPIVHVV